ncbi:MAG: VOC family protein [Ktedonobacteraceae bacterium]
MIALSNRVHMFARPDVRDKLTTFFTGILGLKVLVSSDAPGLPTSVIAVVFSNGASLSVEFTEDALDEQQARRGAWFELRTDDANTLKQKVLDAGLPRVEYSGNNFFYFQAPGGQVMRIVSIDEK